jgi:hypothetical protein
MLTKRLLLWLIAIIAITGIMHIPPISQDQLYHLFADKEHIFGLIPNGLNVLSNIPFILVGIFAIYSGQKHKKLLINKSIYKPFMIFSIGVFLVGFGSGYYHYEPNNMTLIWDRLPMTIAFMALYSIVVSVFIESKNGAKLLPWLIVCGVVSVAYWAITESLGHGDLRLYALVQFLPMILMVLIMFMFKDPKINNSPLILTMFWYGMAKALEMFDTEIYNALNLSVSGHSLKHIAAAIASIFVIKWCVRSVPLDKK